MEILLFAVLLGLIPAMVARGKGRDFLPWWIYGSVLFIIALPHALLLRPELKQLEEQQAAQGLKKCPFCAEMIKPDAKVCRYCGRDLPTPEPEQPTPELPVVAQDVASDDPSGGPPSADKDREQRRERLRAQLEEFLNKGQQRDG